MVRHVIIDALVIAKLAGLPTATLPPPAVGEPPHMAASRPSPVSPRKSGGRPIILRMADGRGRLSAFIGRDELWPDWTSRSVA